MPDWAGGLFLELRENAAKALNDRSWDPVTLAVADRRELLLWVRWLDVCGTRHSPVLTGLRGWLIVFEVCLDGLCFCGGNVMLTLREGSGWKEDQAV
jgi:hypothetical protein